MGITFTEKQLDAIKSALKWFYVDSFNQQVFVLSGVAGSGKSTVVKTIITMLGLPDYDVIFATLTAKASLVLRLKGNPSNTIHSTFYYSYKHKNSYSFSLKPRIPSNIKLIVIDEASMVPNKMLEDIRSFGVPIILLGDSAQLPPVFGMNDYMADERNLDVFLTDVMRQDDTSGILDLATKSRKGEPLALGVYKNSLVTTFTAIEDRIHTYDMVICYSNKNRRLLNMAIRKKLGYTTVYPSVGEKILCMMNNYNYQIAYAGLDIYIINGLIGYVSQDAYLTDKKEKMELLAMKFNPYFLAEIGQDDKIFDIICFKEIFEQYQKDPSKEAFIEALYDDNVEADEIEDICMIDYGYVGTAHKAQGSEYNNVLVIVDVKGKSPDFYNKYMYSSITRAMKSVTVAFLE